MKMKPTMDRRLLHPAANKAIAMSPDGAWMSYSLPPVAGPESWKKQTADTVCFRIAAMQAPNWSGDWQSSLLVFEEDKSS